jgi:hypothetical protein
VVHHGKTTKSVLRKADAGRRHVQIQRTNYFKSILVLFSEMSETCRKGRFRKIPFSTSPKQVQSETIVICVYVKVKSDLVHTTTLSRNPKRYDGEHLPASQWYSRDMFILALLTRVVSVSSLFIVKHHDVAQRATVRDLVTLPFVICSKVPI